jgi:hypothetical protein
MHGQVLQTPRHLGLVQANDIRVKKQGDVTSIALAMVVSSRLWLADEVSEHRGLPLIRPLIERMYAYALQGALLCCMDGLCTYIDAICVIFRDAVRPGVHGQPKFRH